MYSGTRASLAIALDNQSRRQIQWLKWFKRIFYLEMHIFIYGILCDGVAYLFAQVNSCIEFLRSLYQYPQSTGALWARAPARDTRRHFIP